MTRIRGFTLLELVIVLALMGLAAALVAPPAARSLARWRHAAELDVARSALQRLPLQARATGRRMDFPEGRATTAMLSDWPQDATLNVTRAWTVAADGACSAGQVDVTWPEQTRTLRIEAPYCRVEVLR